MDLSILSVPYSLNKDQIFYQENNYIKLKNVLSVDVLEYFNRVITEKVNALNIDETSLEERDTYGKAFLQMMNLWVDDPIIKKLIFSNRLAKLAAELIQVEWVRLYHDQALFKEAGGGITPWHADQYYWPLSNDNTITAWIPLQATPLKMGPLEFCAGSHVIKHGRDLFISDSSENQIAKTLRVTDFEHVIEPFDVGEISFHSGWLFHRAGPNTSNDMRKVMTIIYFDKNMKLKAPKNNNQINDWKTWCPGAKVGSIIDTPLNPILF